MFSVAAFIDVLSGSANTRFIISSLSAFYLKPLDFALLLLNHRMHIRQWTIQQTVCVSSRPKKFLLLPKDQYIDHLADHVHRRAYILSSVSIPHGPFTLGVAPCKDPMRSIELLHMFDTRDENRVEHRLLQRRAIVG
jgi:hypothetical protein